MRLIRPRVWALLGSAMLRLMPVVSIAIAGCAPQVPEHSDAPGDPRDLAGTWHVLLRKGAWTTVIPVSGHILHGQLTLAPSADRDSMPTAGGRRVPCRGCLRGTFRLDPGDWLRVRPGLDSASAYVFADGTTLIYLLNAGRCSDCGNLTLEGNVGRDRVSGGWSEERLGGGIRGAFTLRRAPATVVADRRP